MAQVKYPISDITNPAEVTGTFADIDDDSDADYIYGTNNSNDTCEFLIDTMEDPGSSADHTVIWRQAQADDDAGTVAPTSGGAASDYSCWLYQGATLIATMRSLDTSNEGSFLEESYTLSGAEADNITDYTDLRVRFTLNGSGGAPSGRRTVAISSVKVSVPDAPSRNRYFIIA